VPRLIASIASAAVALAAPSLAPSAARAQADTGGCPGAIVFFDFDSSALTAQAVALLDMSWEWLRPMIEAGAWLNVDARTDDVGPAPYNLALSRRRAEAVVAYYRRRGLRRDQLRVNALGESRPLERYDDRQPLHDVRRQNRYANVWPEMSREVFHRFYPPGGPIC